MGKDAGSAPATPDPAKLLAAQSSADKQTFNYQTDANRFNTTGPDGSNNWTKTPTFDQNGYDTALADWNGRNSKGTWVPDTMTQTGIGPDNSVWSNVPGHWDGATSDNSLAPTRDAFTSNKWTNTTTLSPEQQAIHDSKQGADSSQAQILEALTKRLQGRGDFSTDGAPSLVTGLDSKNFMDDPQIQAIFAKMNGMDPKAYSQEAGDAAYGQATRYLDPQVQQNQKSLEARLSEQGFVPGTPGYAQAMQTMQDTNNRAYADARDRATTQGFSVGHTQFGDSEGQLQSILDRMFSGKQGDFENDKAAGAFQNTARGQRIAELLQEHNTPLDDINKLRAGLSSGANAPPPGGAGSGATLNPTDTLGAYNSQYKSLMDKYNADVSSDNATTSTVGSVVGMIAAAFL